ncbi:MCE family protein [Gordonia humi]|uniref:Phospholipid/cholesterol/gamma-HCH transport system substrate-binding protein n=1 Tax=Gordonia humi TaxID=686429 RepID=A0A840ES60_9ACTN|nr:MCE family protein [Gordonia humi]MBB4134532.1 phospholipid/cholesterol/gamma-HCH transport system substrate-binding protein [Gordonia humi]
MKITGFVRMQLIVFSIVSVISLIAVAVFYIRVPQMFGLGSYTVNVTMPVTGGLYKNANVSFRGVNVGKVSGVRLTGDGVEAQLRIDTGTDIPANSAAAVRSVSAIGEQFVEFTPPADPSSQLLSNGATVSTDDVPVEISTMLDQADALLADVGDTKLRAVMDEAFTAFNGTADDLSRLMDSMVLFVGAFHKNVDAAIDLVTEAGPILETQNRTASQIRSWTKDMTTVTDQLRASRPDITDILVNGPGVANQAKDLFDDMGPGFITGMSNLKVAAQTQRIYLPNLRQTIVLYPRVLSALITAINTGSNRHGPNVNFTLGFQDPPTCSVGFLPPDKWRFPSETAPQDLPPGMLCRLPQDAQTSVRGARNFPCVEFPGRRAPTPEECRTGFTPSPRDNVALPNGFPGTDLPKQPAGYVVPGTPSDYDPSPATYATTYDPESGKFIGPDGKMYSTDAGKDREQKTKWYELITKAADS